QHLERAVAPRKPEQNRSPDKSAERQALYREYLEADAESDLAFALHGMGLESDGALRRALYRRNEARQNLEAGKGLMRQLSDEAARELAAKPAPEREPEADQPEIIDDRAFPPARRQKKRRTMRK
ncbi:MAG: hypothetical protein KDJ29_21105, partial [Hyphomicrobiales bacterium]|nr:hypothetical protein [Hyphomicrobiales bacterium]